MWQPGPMKGFVSNMFRMVNTSAPRLFVSGQSAIQTRSIFGKTQDVITLFHSPSAQASIRANTILKQASAQASQHATEDQAADHSHQNKTVQRTEPFELEVTEDAPTADQLKSIFEYVGSGKASSLVQGASSESEAMRKVKQDSGSFIRPVVVDWSEGKAVIGDQESEILKLLKMQK